MRVALAERGTLQPVPTTTPAEVRAWFAERVPMVLPREAVRLLDQWDRELRSDAARSGLGGRPEGPGRTPGEALPLIAWLREHAVAGRPCTFNALHREPQGGRMYPYVLSDYVGPLTVSRTKYAEAKRRGPRLMLSATRRDVRQLVTAPSGWSLVELDFRSCHAAIGVALCGDEQLARDVDVDVHQVIGDLAFPDGPDAKTRRRFGKQLNNAMFFGMGVRGLAKLTQELLGRPPRDSTGEKAWCAWWGRYPALAAFRDEVQALVGRAQKLRADLSIVAPSGRVSRFHREELMGRSFSGAPARAPEDVWRTVFSALFRAVEGDLLDGTLRRLHSSGGRGRPMLPLYDGGLFAAPVDCEEEFVRALEATAAKAAADLGLQKVVSVAERR